MHHRLSIRRISTWFCPAANKGLMSKIQSSTVQPRFTGMVPQSHGNGRRGDFSAKVVKGSYTLPTKTPPWLQSGSNPSYLETTRE
jgi:hypothetical protein